MFAWLKFQSLLYNGHMWTMQVFIPQNNKQLYKFIRSAVSLTLPEVIMSLQLNTLVSLWRIRTKLYKPIHNKTGCDGLLPSFLPSLLSFHFIFCRDQVIHTDALGFFLIILHIQNCLYEQLRLSLDQVS